MIDFLKISIRDQELMNTVWENPNLIFQSDEDRRFKDEIRTIRKKFYNELTFTLYADRLEITGSLHKYFNHGIHNANDFSFIDSVNVIRELEDLFSLDTKKCIVENLEFGLNVIPDESVKKLVVWLKFHERNEFRYYPELQFAKQSGSYQRNGKINTYKIIKAYAKGLQQFAGQTYGDPNTFRFEVRTKQTKYIRKMEIATLDDLTNLDAYSNLGSELLKEWNSVLLMDKSLPETNKTAKYQSLDFWETCLNEYRNKFSTQRKKYFKLLENFPDNLYHKIKQLFEKKLKSFEMEYKKSGTISTRLLNNEKNKSGAISSYVKDESALSIICIVTGHEIKHPAPGKKYLTISDIKFYYEHDGETYTKKLESLLTRKWKNRNQGEPLETWFDEICHKIRCKLSNERRNPTNNTKRSFKNIESKGLILWPTEELADRKKLALLAI
jgi:hypothetical protein